MTVHKKLYLFAPNYDYSGGVLGVVAYTKKRAVAFAKDCGHDMQLEPAEGPWRMTNNIPIGILFDRCYIE